MTVIRIIINSNSQRPVPAARPPNPPAGTYTAQGRRVPPSATGSELQIKLPVVSAGPRGEGARARRLFPRKARVSGTTRPRALATRPRSRAAERLRPLGATHSELRCEEPVLGNASQTQPPRRAQDLRSTAPPASLPPLFCCCCCGRQM